MNALVDINNENNYRSCREKMSTELTNPPIRELQRAAPQKVASEALLGQSHELVIVHNGREYRLRLTQNDKLILTA